MVRTQIQLTEAQAKALKGVAAAERISMAELVRLSIEGFLRARGGRSRDSLKRQAVSVAGRFRSGVRDLSAKHDRYLTDTYDK